MIIIKYETEEEVQPIVNAQIALGFHLIAVSNIIEGKFLGFDDRTEIQQTTQPTNQEIIDGQLVLMDVMATMFEAMIEKGTV